MLCRRIAEGKLADGFTARDVQRKGWGGIKTTADAESALGVLEEHGLVVGRETDDSQGGRPTTRYVINPKVKGGK